MSPFFSNNDIDEFDQKMAGILQGSIATMFRQLIEPVDSGRQDSSTTKSTPPPLKLHDFGGSDFIRLAEKSRRNRRATIRKQDPLANDKDWKCVQECVVRSDGSEEVVYQKFEDGLPTESLHHVLYPDNTSKYISKPIIPTSSSHTSSLSSLDTTSPLKKLWYRAFD